LIYAIREGLITKLFLAKMSESFLKIDTSKMFVSTHEKVFTFYTQPPGVEVLGT